MIRSCPHHGSPPTGSSQTSEESPLLDVPAPIREALEALYRAFAEVPRPLHLVGCPCCSGRVDLARLAAAPLKDLAEEDLALYAAKAITTVGGATDFVYFVPRLLELLVSNALRVDVEIVLGKLGLAELASWPPALSAAVEGLLWAELIERVRAEELIPIDEWLCGIALATPNLAPWLRRLSQAEPLVLPPVIRRLQGRLRTEWSPGAFWEGAASSLVQLQSWIREAPGGRETLYDERGLFAIKLLPDGALWISVDRERGAGVVETKSRRLTDAESMAVWNGDAETARALAWQVHDGHDEALASDPK